MNIKKTTLTSLVLSFSILFVWCQTQENNGRENYNNKTETSESTVIINEDNKNKTIEITSTPLTIRNEILWFEIKLWEERSWGYVYRAKWWNYYFDKIFQSSALYIETWEKDDFDEEEFDLTDPTDKEVLDIFKVDILNWVNITKIIPKDNERVRKIGYTDQPRYAIWSNNKYYFSIVYNPETILNSFENNICMYVEIEEYPYSKIYCPSILTDLFEKIDFFDVK